MKKGWMRPVLTLIQEMALTRKAEPGNDRYASGPEASQNNTDMMESYRGRFCDGGQ